VTSVFRCEIDLFVYGDFARHEEVHQGSQLTQCVLDWGTSNEKTTRSVELLQFLVELRLTVLEAMSLVDGKELPFDARQKLPVGKNVLVSCQQNVELDLPWIAVDQEFLVSDGAAGVFSPRVDDIVDVWCPVVERVRPGGHS
jgi:hypothetical protein